MKYTIFRVSHGGTSCCEQTWQIANFYFKKWTQLKVFRKIPDYKAYLKEDVLRHSQILSDTVFIKGIIKWNF